MPLILFGGSDHLRLGLAPCTVVSVIEGSTVILITAGEIKAGVVVVLSSTIRCA